MKILMACDHGGLELKNYLKTHLTDYQIEDLGTFSSDSVDYPDYAQKLCERIPAISPHKEPEVFGILVCGSGQGMAIKANKFKHIRAALCWDLISTKLSREHNNANVLCLGGRLIPFGSAVEMANVFLKTAFAGGRHATRVDKMC